MSNDKLRSVELDQDQMLLLLALCGRQMVKDANHGYHDPILASTTVELIKVLAPQPQEDDKAEIPA
jgi:hypothetical protein